VVSAILELPGGNFTGGCITWEELYTEEFLVRRGNFPLGVSQIYRYYLKNDQKLNKKDTVFN
jgi:hypothetical protein